ncbi:SRPBCC family protein [Paenibacillus harenae]|uniref:SRPBCC family protein n=1 Tax=Paenibacillus harenae TaxID=306543 RepID=UPI0003FE6EF0|nr:SRPBCC family protein [Paenibacillus harenae]
MLAEIEKVEAGYIARYERHFKHTAEQVWAMLTENDRLAEWFPELRVRDLRTGGIIAFDMQDGTFEEMEIVDLTPYSALEYTWGEDRVRFELYPEAQQCRLVFIEKISTITDQTPKDLAGWHVCLIVIEVLLDGRKLEDRMTEWKVWYEQYKTLLNSVEGKREQ